MVFQGKSAGMRGLLAPAALAFVGAIYAGSAAAQAAQPAPAPTKPQAANASAGGRVEEVIVTARRRAESLQAVPVSVTAIGAAELEKRSISDISDISRLAPNLTFSGGAVGGAGTAGAAQVFVRGVGQDDYLGTADPGVGIYLDGVYLGRTTGSILQVVNLERLEVLRGPQGTLFGRNTIGGAISLVSKAPSKELTGGVALTAGQNSLLEFRGNAFGPLGENVRGRLSAVRRVQDGLGRSTRVSGDLGNVDRYSFAGLLDFDLTDKFTVRLSGDFGKTDQQAPAQVLTAVGTFSPVSIPGAINATAVARGFQPLNAAAIATDPYIGGASTLGYDRANVGGIALSAQYKINDHLTLASITSHRTSDSEFLADVDGSNAPINEVTAYVDQKQTSQEFQLNGAFEKIDFTLGAYYFSEDVGFEQLVNLAPGLYGYLRGLGTCPTPGAAPIPGPPSACFFASRGFRSPSTIKTDSFAAFGQATIKWTDRFSTTIGLRQSQDDKDFATRPVNLVTGLTTPGLVDPVTGGPATRSKKFDSFTPRYGAEFKVSDSLFLFASYASGYKSGTFNGRAAAGAGLTEAEPEEADTIEVGFKSDLFGNRLRFNATYFSVDYRNLQTTVSATDATGSVFTALLNAAEAESSGVEVELLARPTPNLRFGVNYGYTDAEIVKSTPGAVAQGILVGNKLGKTPQNTGAIFAEYTWPIGEGSLTARGAYSWQSSMFHLTSNNPNTREQGYGVLNGRLAWDSAGGRYGIAVFGTNLTDELYAVNRSWVGAPRLRDRQFRAAA